MMIDAERLDRTARAFRRFAQLECRGSSPLYERLSLGIAEDRELLELATHARPGQPVHLFFSCVHWLLLAGTQHPVSAFYPSLDQGPIPDGDPYASFRDF